MRCRDMTWKLFSHLDFSSVAAAATLWFPKMFWKFPNTPKSFLSCWPISKIFWLFPKIPEDFLVYHVTFANISEVLSVLWTLPKILWNIVLYYQSTINVQNVYKYPAILHSKLFCTVSYLVGMETLSARFKFFVFWRSKSSWIIKILLDNFKCVVSLWIQ